MRSPRFGDYVRLNSGGPLMLVVDIYHDGNQEMVACSWSGHDGIKEDAFPTACVELARATE